jgi:hypothetical protein
VVVVVLVVLVVLSVVVLIHRCTFDCQSSRCAVFEGGGKRVGEGGDSCGDK